MRRKTMGRSSLVSIPSKGSGRNLSSLAKKWLPLARHGDQAIRLKAVHPRILSPEAVCELGLI